LGGARRNVTITDGSLEDDRHSHHSSPTSPPSPPSPVSPESVARPALAGILSSSSHTIGHGHAAPLSSSTSLPSFPPHRGIPVSHPLHTTVDQRASTGGSAASTAPMSAAMEPPTATVGIARHDQVTYISYPLFNATPHQ
jgi:hypothetical protein